MTRTLRECCLAILRAEDLEGRLLPLPAGVRDRAPGPALDIEGPGRTAALAARPGAGRLPRPAELTAPAARARCLARFAHHELQAVELFAWALLRWPDAPPDLRRDWARVLRDEQRHCRLYLERLAAHGERLAAHPQTDYFWLQVPRIRAARNGPAAFLAAMGLTLEQANLDFTLLYRDAFRAAGDPESARVCQRVHDDEVRHVRIAAQWLRRLHPGPAAPLPRAADAPPEARGEARLDDAARYRACVPFPLSPARARGRRFDARARERAGLDASLIALVRDARPEPAGR